MRGLYFVVSMLSVAKRIAPSGADQDFDLNNEYFVLYGQRVGDSGLGFLVPHEMGPGDNPRITSRKVNPAIDVSVAVPTTTATDNDLIAPVSNLIFMNIITRH